MTIGMYASVCVTFKVRSVLRVSTFAIYVADDSLSGEIRPYVRVRRERGSKQHPNVRV